MESRERTVEERLAQLEREIAELRWVLGRVSANQGAGAGATGSAHAGASRAGRAASGTGARTDRRRRGSQFDVTAVLGEQESWLAKGGIALVGLGVLLLFKYAVDQGWITPALRCVIGLVVGVALYVVAWRVRDRHPVWSQIVVGGGLGILYLTIWASSVLYDLVPVMVAFAGLAIVSGEMVRQGAGVSNASLAVIGTIFGFAAPLLLSDVGLTAPLVVLAYALVLAAACVLVFARRGWLLLVAATAAGAFLLLAQLGDPTPAQRIEMQTSLVVLWLLVAIAPLVIEPPDGRVVGLGIPVDDVVRRLARSGVLRVALLGATVAALARTATAWNIEGHEAVGVLVGVPALVFAAVAWITYRRESEAYHAAVETATLLLLAAVAIGLRDGWLLTGEAAILTVASWIASRTDARGLGWIAHLGFIGLALAISRVFDGEPTPSRAIGALAAIVCVVPVARWHRDAIAKAYRLAAYAFFLFWLLWVLYPLPQGTLLGSAVWGAIGTGLVVAGTTRDRLSFQQLGLATLAATAAKMLLYDLATAATLWRIALFIGFGSVLLGVGYYLRERRARGESA